MRRRAGDLLGARDDFETGLQLSANEAESRLVEGRIEALPG
jgi:hypothetical protein